MSVKIIDKRIARFSTNVGKLKSQAHEIAMLIFDHAFEHGDCTRMAKLAQAMPKSWQPQLTAWCKAFTPIRLSSDFTKSDLDPKYKTAMKAGGDKAAFWNREAAAEMPFHMLTEEPAAAKPLDFAALVKLVEGLSKRIAKKVEDGAVPDEDKASALAIANTLSGLHFQRVKPANDVKSKDDVPLPAPALAAVA